MCTAVAYKANNLYFGRTLDFEFLYPCEVTFTPRNYPFGFCFLENPRSHYAMLGMAYVKDNYPLYFDAVNEKGLCMAGLNFVGNAVYREYKEGKENVASFEFIPYVLGKCKSVAQAKELLEYINITNAAFEGNLPPSELHWIISDKEESVVVESVAEGIRIYTDTIGVLTNNPPYEYHLRNLEKLSFLSPWQAEADGTDKGYSDFSRGTGAVGLPGDFTSASRFVRAAFLKENSHSAETDGAGLNQLFHILCGVSVPEGACVTEKGEYDKTLYTCGVDADKGVYCYKAYESQGVFSVDMKKEDADGCELICYPFLRNAPVNTLN